uniref:T-box domain-containing protein n=1 Tax=Ascaris lumbricoides TaxID=6252 RepID=A0A0M3I5F5_ASCLU
MTSQMTAKVANEEMWSKFHGCGNEMIVIKSGRKLFPRVGFEVCGVEPMAHYSLALSIVRVDENRYKFEDGRWIIAGRVHSDDSTVPSVQRRVIQHHGGALSGTHLLKGPVYFDQLALTNDRDSEVGSKVFVQTLCKYRPHLSICRVEEEPTTWPSEERLLFSDALMEFIAVTQFNVALFVFVQTLCKYRPHLSICRVEEEPTTWPSEERLLFSDALMEFIAVTQYQNIHIVELKNQFNPYAKGQRFRRHDKIFQSRKRSSDYSNNSNSPKQMKLCERTKSCSMQSTVFPMLPKPPDVTSGIHPSAFINPFIGCFSPSTFWNYPFWNAVSPFCSVVSPFSSSGAVPFAYLTPTRISNAATIQEI